MPKRALNSALTSQHFPSAESDSDDYIPGHSCSESEPRKPPQDESRRSHKKHKTNHIADGQPVPGDTPLVNMSMSFVHARSSHNIRFGEHIRLALLEWYATVHASRGMPWRRPYDTSLSADERSQRAYEVWVSEIMLQQTQVATVIPYYNRWMEKFPTIRDLACSNTDTVNALWKGLGYYSRASRLLEGAKKAVKEFNGRLPDNAKDMQEHIPGIGRYSAGAICSIAYGEKAAVLDGNVHRLLSRVLALHAPPKSKTTLDVLWAAAAELVQTDEGQFPGDVNQALIELGSTVCKVRDPGCDICPIRSWCRAYDQTNRSASSETPPPDVFDIEDICTICAPLPESITVTAYPMKADRKKPREELDIVNVVQWSPKAQPKQRWFLLVRRPKTGLLAGLFEFPSSQLPTRKTSRKALSRIPNEILSDLLEPTLRVADSQSASSLTLDGDDFYITGTCLVGDVVHVFSHIRKTYRVQLVVLEGGDSPPKLRPEVVGLFENPSRKKAGSKIPHDEGQSTETPAGAMWVKTEDVQNANIGTGVVKIWKKVKDFLAENENSMRTE